MASGPTATARTVTPIHIPVPFIFMEWPCGRIYFPMSVLVTKRVSGVLHEWAPSAQAANYSMKLNAAHASSKARCKFSASRGGRTRGEGIQSSHSVLTASHPGALLHSRLERIRMLLMSCAAEARPRLSLLAPRL
jgi:hypothetical protein